MPPYVDKDEKVHWLFAQNTQHTPQSNGELERDR